MEGLVYARPVQMDDTVVRQLYATKSRSLFQGILMSVSDLFIFGIAGWDGGLARSCPESTL